VKVTFAEKGQGIENAFQVLHPNLQKIKEQIELEGENDSNICWVFANWRKTNESQRKKHHDLT
jgi:hypothetical protein